MLNDNARRRLILVIIISKIVHWKSISALICSVKHHLASDLLMCDTSFSLSFYFLEISRGDPEFLDFPQMFFKFTW